MEKEEKGRKKKREQEERKYSEAGEYLMTGIGFLRQIKTPIIKRQIISPPMYWEEEEEEQEEEEGKEEEEKYKKEWIMKKVQGDFFQVGESIKTLNFYYAFLP